MLVHRDRRRLDLCSLRHGEGICLEDVLLPLRSLATRSSAKKQREADMAACQLDKDEALDKVRLKANETMKTAKADMAPSAHPLQR